MTETILEIILGINTLLLGIMLPWVIKVERRLAILETKLETVIGLKRGG